MIKCRKFSRFQVGLECYLRVNADNSYKALLYDLSFGGARILVDDFITLESGEFCELVMSSKQVDFPVIHNSKIIWVDSGNLGVSFLS